MTLSFNFIPSKVPVEDRVEKLGLCDYCLITYEHRIRISADDAVYCVNCYYKRQHGFLTDQEVANNWIKKEAAHRLAYM